MTVPVSLSESTHLFSNGSAKDHKKNYKLFAVNFPESLLFKKFGIIDIISKE
jgi:hypothetical protein